MNSRQLHFAVMLDEDAFQLLVDLLHEALRKTPATQPESEMDEKQAANLKSS